MWFQSPRSTNGRLDPRGPRGCSSHTHTNLASADRPTSHMESALPSHSSPGLRSARYCSHSTWPRSSRCPIRYRVLCRCTGIAKMRVGCTNGRSCHRSGVQRRTSITYHGLVGSWPAAGSLNHSDMTSLGELSARLRTKIDLADSSSGDNGIVRNSHSMAACGGR
jgi:hypothetical protein